MKCIVFKNYTQYSFWGNVDYASNAEAKRKRDEMYRAFKKEGRMCRRSMIKDQLRKYAGFGQPDGTIGNVYYLEVTT